MCFSIRPMEKSLLPFSRGSQSRAASSTIKGAPMKNHYPLLAFAFFLSVALLLALTASAESDDKNKKEAPVVPPRKGESETIQLFNGKDLDGWVGHENLWSVQDGVIVAKNTEPIKVSTYLLTKRHF